ncbi:uracil-DNA glycosylase [Mycolicibacter sinensis]|uniref:uracil-DNA glycosylase n=1 Tax=Mycolicibacter sinensis (strain JDM601) TaxID=875328 RepID=UPI00059C574C|nr:uracil-DNA glycosylase family protein [Mycolicibacter sinensis]
MTRLDPAPQHARRIKKQLDADIKACDLCPGLNIPGDTESAPGYGSLSSPVALVGQSLCEQCMAVQEPFFEKSGNVLQAAIDRAQVDKSDLFITNAVHCHPPKNRPSRPYEIENCRPFLRRELELVQPRLVVALGKDARDSAVAIYPQARAVWWEDDGLPTRRPRRGSPVVWCTHHPGSLWRNRTADQRREVTEAWTEALAHAIAWGFGAGR